VKDYIQVEGIDYLDTLLTTVELVLALAYMR